MPRRRSPRAVASAAVPAARAGAAASVGSFSSFTHLLGGDGVVFERFVFLVEDPSAEIGGAPAVNNRGTDDVLPLLQREAFGDAVVDDCLPIAVDADDFLAIHPPNRSCIRSDG